MTHCILSEWCNGKDRRPKPVCLGCSLNGSGPDGVMFWSEAHTDEQWEEIEQNLPKLIDKLNKSTNNH